MLQAIQHAELCLGYKFSKEDFSEGRVGEMMAPEDFNFEENVSLYSLHDTTNPESTTMVLIIQYVTVNTTVTGCDKCVHIYKELEMQSVHFWPNAVSA